MIAVIQAAEDWITEKTAAQEAISKFEVRFKFLKYLIIYFDDNEISCFNIDENS